MPNFGDYETVGEPLAVLNLQGHSSVVWKARKAGAPDNREFIVKCYSPHRRAKEGGVEEALDRDRGLEFLEGVKQLKKAHTEDPRFLVPVHDLGISPDGAWYVSDFFPRGSLMALIGRRAKVDSAALKQIVGCIVAACLALKKSRGASHGNLKPSNVFLAGKTRPLPQTQIVLADPVPAAPLQLARLEPEDRKTVDELLHQVSEVQDLRALGEIILQLVERRIIRSGYCDPPQRSELWDGLGKDGERWRQICVQLLDPKLSLAEISFESLAKKFPARAAPSGAALIVAAGLVALCLLGGSVYGIAHWNTHRHDEKCQELTNVAQQAFQSGDLVAARKNIIEALKWRPENTAALNLSTTITKQIDQQYDSSIRVATEKSNAGRWKEALNDLNGAFLLKPDGAEALSLKKKIEAAQTTAANRAVLEQQYQAAMDEGHAKLAGGDYDGAVAQAETALNYVPGAPEALQLKKDALGRKAEAVAAAQRQGYDKAMQTGRTKLEAGDYDGALVQADAALKARPNDDEATKLKNDALKQQAAASAAAQQQKDYDNAIQNARQKYGLGDYAGTIAQADLALAIKPNDAAALKLKHDAADQQTATATAAQRQKDYDNAMQSGREKYALGDYASAITQANLALANKPNDATALKLRNDATTQQAAVAAAAQQQKNYDNAMQIGQAKFAAGDYAAAITQANVALANKPNDTAALKLKNDATAQQAAAAVAAQQQKNYDNAMQTGQAKLAAGDYAGTIAQADAALAIKPNDTAALKLKSDAHDQQAAAAAAVQKKKNYDNAMQTGQAKFAAGDYAAAITQADLALANEPNDATALKLKHDATAQQTAAATAAQQQQNYAKAMETGQAKYAAGDYATAITQADLALANKANDAAALKLKNDATAQKGRLDGLDAELQRLCIELGVSKPAWLNIAGVNATKYTYEMDLQTIDSYKTRVKNLEGGYQAGGWYSQNRKDCVGKLNNNLANR